MQPIVLSFMTSSDLQSDSHIASFIKYNFGTVVLQLIRFQLTLHNCTLSER